MTVPERETFFRRNRRRVLAGVAGLVLVATLIGGIVVFRGDADATSGVPTFAVQRGPLTISVSESGTITARDQVVITSDVQGRPTIIYLIPEGQRVEKGDLLVELDSSGLQTDLVDQEIKVQNAEASLIQAQEEFAVAQSQAQSDISQAELAYRFAQEDLRKYIEGEYPKQLEEAETQITLRAEARKQAEDSLVWSERLFAEKYISESDLERDRLAFKRADLELSMARREKDLLENFTHRRQLAQLESDVEQTQMALDRTRRSARASIVQAEARLRARQSEFDRELRRRDHIEDQIAKCRIVAPVAGMVVYATTGQGSWRGNAEPLAEGQQVRERQELIHLPTASAMQAEVKVHESALDRIAVGMPVRVTVDALPGKTYTGRVSRISPLPDAQSVWMNPDLKVYSTIIELDGELTDVRTGMTCRAEILINRYPEATFVPVQSVVRVGRQPTVYVRNGTRFEPRPVEIGLNNNRMVRIVGGLEPGEVVSLAPPLAPATLDDDDDVAFARDDAPAGATGEPLAAAPAEGAAAPAATGVAAGDGGAAGDRRRGENMTPEQREQMRRRFENMTPEQREQAREQFLRQRQAAETAGAEAGL
jgi:HlyD family secretion protein